MPVSKSRLKGFYKLSLEEKHDFIQNISSLESEDIDRYLQPLELELAQNLVENVIGIFSLPIGLGTNFVIDDQPYVIPFVTEESSVVASACNAARRCHIYGGFQTSNDDPIMIGQVQILNVPNLIEAKQNILEHKEEIMELCDSCSKTAVKLGGGCKNIEVKILDQGDEVMLIVTLLIDVRDAMGANLVNTMAEKCGPLLEELTGGTVLLRILSNLCIHRMARARAIFSPMELSKK